MIIYLIYLLFENLTEGSGKDNMAYSRYQDGNTQKK